MRRGSIVITTLRTLYSSPSSVSKSQIPLSYRLSRAQHITVSKPSVISGASHTDPDGSRRPLLPGSAKNESKPGANKFMEQQGQIREAKDTAQKMYKKGSYEDALGVTERVIDLADGLFGKTHAVYASALGDHALMLKSLGRFSAATDTYLKALEIYRIVYNGEENASFATTLHNLGMVFRVMADQGKSFDKIPLLERTQECFARCLEIRQKILPVNDPDLQLVKSRLAMVVSLLGGEKHRVEAKLRAALDGLVVGVGEQNLNTATAMTNLALFLKKEGKYDEAHNLYAAVVRIRKALLGPLHENTIVAMYNLAELFRASGREDEALHIQAEIVKIGEKLEAEEQAKDKAAAEERKLNSEPEQAEEREGDGGESLAEEGVTTTWTPNK